MKIGGHAVSWAGLGMERPRATEGAPLFLILTCALIIRVAMAARVVPDQLFDDGYITLRYAANLARGWGFVFNRGEHVCGTSTPLFTLMLAALGRVFGVQHIEAIAVTLCVLFFFGALYLTAHVLRRAAVPLPLAWVYLILLAVLPAFLSISVSGMETPLVLFLMAASLLCFMQERFGWVALLCGLLLLTRIDTVIWTGVLGLQLLLENRAGKWRELAKGAGIFLLTILPWYVFAAFYFGTIIPQSVVGKAVSHGALHVLDRNYVVAFLNSFVPGVRSPRFGWVAALLTLVIVTLGMENLWRRLPALRPLVTFTPLYCAAFLLGRAPLFEWYFVPVKWAYYLIVLCGIWRAIERAPTMIPLRFSQRLAGALLVVMAVTYGGSYLRQWFGNREVNPWIEVSAVVEKNTGGDARIFLEHIGLVGYKTNRYIFDSMGLVTPRSVELKRAYGDDWLPKATVDFAADVVVFYQWDLDAMQRSRDPDASRFWQAYARVGEFHSAESPIVVFFRRNSRAALLPSDTQGPGER